MVRARLSQCARSSKLMDIIGSSMTYITLSALKNCPFPVVTLMTSQTASTRSTDLACARRQNKSLSMSAFILTPPSGNRA